MFAREFSTSFSAMVNCTSSSSWTVPTFIPAYVFYPRERDIKQAENRG